MRASTTFLLCVLATFAITAVSAADVKVIFYDHTDQHGNSASFPVSLTNQCTKCEGFGFRITNSWESFSLVQSGSARYDLHIYDDGHCGSSTKQATLPSPNGNFPGTLKNSVDSWILCPAGVNP